MLYRSDLYVCTEGTEKPQSEITVKIHGAMMKQIPSEYAEKLHISGYHPYSIYAFNYGRGYVIRVSALNEEARIIVDSMSQMKEIELYGVNDPLRITDVKPYETVDGKKIESITTGNSCRVELITPAMIKTGGYPSNMPDLPNYFYSVIQKYNAFEDDNLDFNEFAAAFSAAKLTSYSLESADYNVSGIIFPGMKGFFDVEFPSDKKCSTLLKKVFAYSSYSGVGGKTGMGMGGVVLEF